MFFYLPCSRKLTTTHCRRHRLFDFLLCCFLVNQVATLTESSSSYEPKLMVKTFISPLLDQSHSNKTVLIVLNTPIQRPPSVWFQKLWKLSHQKICADGGANRLYEATQPSLDYIPHIIRGDLDSLEPTVQEYYKNHDCLIEKDPDQDTNDLDKALQRCMNNKNSSDFKRVLVYGAFGGRFDQEMASLHALYKWGPKFDYQLFLYNDETCAFLIPPNTPCEIRLPFYDTSCSQECDGKMGEGPTCGLIPLGMRCDSITTTGLKWNLDGDLPLDFTQFISTSNRIMEPVVTIQSSHPIVFTADVRVHN